VFGEVKLCDPYLSAIEAFARRRAIQIHVYLTAVLVLGLSAHEPLT